jgi:hypothetical protein
MRNPDRLLWRPVTNPWLLVNMSNVNGMVAKLFVEMDRLVTGKVGTSTACLITNISDCRYEDECTVLIVCSTIVDRADLSPYRATRTASLDQLAYPVPRMIGCRAHLLTPIPSHHFRCCIT